MCYGPNKKDGIEEKLLKIIENQKKSLMKMKCFFKFSSPLLRKIQHPQKKEYTKLQLQQTLYNCIYGSQPNVGQTQPQVQQVQNIIPMPQQQQTYNYHVNSDGSTFASF